MLVKAHRHKSIPGLYILVDPTKQLPAKIQGDVPGHGMTQIAADEWVYARELDLEPATQRIGIDVDKALADVTARGWHAGQAVVKFTEVHSRG